MADNTEQKLDSFDDLRAALNMPSQPLDATGAPAEKPVEPPPAEDKPADPTPAPAEPPATPPVEPPAPPADKKPKRFSELTRELEAARQREAALAAQLAAAQAPKPAEAPKPEPLPEADGKPVPPDAENFKGTWMELEAARAKYVEDRVAWEVKNALHQKEVQAARDAVQAAAQTVQERWNAAYNAAVDADHFVADAVKEVGEALVNAKKHGVIEVIKESEIGVEIVQELHKDAAALKKLASMSLASAAREIGKIEAAILGRKAPAKPAAEPLPPPPMPVGGAASGSSSGPDMEKLGDLPMTAFKNTVGKMLSNKPAGIKADRRSL